MNIKKSDNKTARLFRAITLHGFWKLRWYHTALLWLMLAAYAWGASPYFMVYVVGMPEPGTSPRYVGTVRVEGELQRTKTGWKPPKYFIKTDKGEVEFHCGYLPSRTECWLSFMLGVKPKSDDVYVIGYNNYWGLDYIKFPQWLSKINDYGAAGNITVGRFSDLRRHRGDAWSLGFGLFIYFLLVWYAYKSSAVDGKDSVLVLGFWRVQKNPTSKPISPLSNSAVGTESLAPTSTLDTNPVKPIQPK